VFPLLGIHHSVAKTTAACVVRNALTGVTCMLRHDYLIYRQKKKRFEMVKGGREEGMDGWTHGVASPGNKLRRPVPPGVALHK
jgi:hypothetical protein